MENTIAIEKTNEIEDVFVGREEQAMGSELETPPQHTGVSSDRPCSYDHQHPLSTSHPECNLKDEHADDVPARHDWRDIEHDALVHIFSFLPYVQWRAQAGTVCKSWLRASLDPGCWKEANVSLSPRLFVDDRKITKTAAAAAVIRSQGQLIRLHAWHCDLGLLYLIGRNCPLLQCLIVMRFEFDGPWMQVVDAVVNGCPLLSELQICMRVGAENWSAFTSKLLSGLPKLTFLLLSSTGIDDGVISAIGDSLPNLEFLWLSGEKYLTDASLGFIGSSRKFMGLKRLTLYLCDELTSWGMKSLRLARPQLQVED